MRLRVTIKVRNRDSLWQRTKIDEIGFSEAEKVEVTGDGETLATFVWDGNGLAQNRLKRNLDLIFAPPRGRKSADDPVHGEVSLERLDEITGLPKKFYPSLAERLGFKRSRT